MKTKYIFKGLIATLLITAAVSGCDTYNEGVIDTLNVSREFSPIGITTKIRNQTTVELNWNLKQEEVVDHYVVEFSADDPEFKTIYKTLNVTQEQLPIQVALEGETVYSIRVKAVSATGLADSNWSVTTATTLSEQIFFPVQETDIEGASATLRWPANSNVTQIAVAPGNITHTITPAEKIAGVATVTGLTGDTFYTATLQNGTKTRGTATFTTGVDVSTGTVINPGDDLKAKITQAAPDAKLYLMPGEYNVYVGDITLAKSITIRGVKSYDKPKLHVNFVIANGTTNVSLIDLDLKGDKGPAGAAVSVVKYNDNNVTYGALLISGCNIHDYGVSLISANLSAAKITSATIDNTVVTNVLTTGGEFIDVRGSQLGQLTLKNSTFNNCATARYFIRMDAGLTGLTANVLIDACTLSNPNMVATNAFSILYTRFVTTSSIIVRNTLFANTPAPYTKEVATPNPTFLNNNYFNSPNLNGNPNALGNNRPDTSGTALDPQFTNAATGNFTVGNQTIKDKAIGDPRWRQ